MQKQKIKIFTLTAIIFAAAFTRIIPHMPNFSPMEAITLFAAAHFARRWQVFVIPFAAMWLSSLFIDNVIYAANHPHFVWMYPGFHWQYLGYGLIALLGLGLFNRAVNFTRVAIGALGASFIFFLVSNFGVWVAGTLYAHNVAGLLACYIAAIPFYTGTILGSAFYSLVLFGGYALLERRFDLSRPATNH